MKNMKEEKDKRRPDEIAEDNFLEEMLNKSENSETSLPRQKSIKNYIKLRLLSQRRWYEEKATSSKKFFINNQKVIIILGAIIPLIVALGSVFEIVNDYSAIISAFISAVIAIIAGIDKLLQPQTSWYNYRASEEILKKEEWLYLYKAGPYHDLTPEEAALLLVERVESVISADMANFIRNSEKQQENKTSETTLPTQIIDNDTLDDITEKRLEKQDDNENEEDTTEKNDTNTPNDEKKDSNNEKTE